MWNDEKLALDLWYGESWKKSIDYYKWWIIFSFSSTPKCWKHVVAFITKQKTFCLIFKSGLKTEKNTFRERRAEVSIFINRKVVWMEMFPLCLLSQRYSLLTFMIAIRLSNFWIELARGRMKQCNEEKFSLGAWNLKVHVLPQQFFGARMKRISIRVERTQLKPILWDITRVSISILCESKASVRICFLLFCHGSQINRRWLSILLSFFSHCARETRRMLLLDFFPSRSTQNVTWNLMHKWETS